MNTAIPSTFLQELMLCPAAAIETPDLRSLYAADHRFYVALDHAQRWRLLYGLQMVLLGEPEPEVEPALHMNASVRPHRHCLSKPCHRAPHAVPLYYLRVSDGAAPQSCNSQRWD